MQAIREQVAKKYSEFKIGHMRIRRIDQLVNKDERDDSPNPAHADGTEFRNEEMRTRD